MGEARTKISLDSGPFEKGAKAVSNAAWSMSTSVKAAFTAAGAAVLVAFGANRLFNTIRETLEFGEAMTNAGRKTGLAAGQFYLFNAAINKGIGLKTAAGLIGKNADVLNRSANLFRDVSIKLWAIGEQVRGFWLGLLERLSPVLSRILDGGLGTALLDAGNDFGAALAHAVETIYQLAKDGKLWTTIKDGFGIAFDYAGERLNWLGTVMFEVLKLVFSTSFVDGIKLGISSVWDSLKTLAKDFSGTIEKGLMRAVALAMEGSNQLLYRFDKFNEKMKLLPAGAADRLLAIRSKPVDFLRTAAGGGEKPQAPEGSNFIEKFKDIFKKNVFEPSKDLAEKIENLGQGLTNAFTKYQKDVEEDPTKTFENNLYPNAFGADSLTQIGGGGGVYLGLSVLDVNKSQLKVLQSIDAKLSGNNASAETQAIAGQYSGQGVTRRQGNSPVKAGGTPLVY